MPWKCPKCGSTDLIVSVDVTAKLIQEDDGNFQTEIAQGDHSWDEGSDMMCCQPQCEYTAPASAFEYKPTDEIYEIQPKDKASWDKVENYVYDHLNPRDLDIDWTSQDFQQEGLYLCMIGGVMVPRHVYDPNYQEKP